MRACYQSRDILCCTLTCLFFLLYEGTDDSCGQIFMARANKGQQHFLHPAYFLLLTEIFMRQLSLKEQKLRIII